MSAPYTMQALQELADDGVHLLEIDDAGLVATVQELDALRARVAELERLTESAQDQTEEAQGIARDAMKRFDEMQALLQEYKADAARLREALEDFLNCPMVVSEGTNPVIVTIHVARERVEKWRAALASAPSAETWRQVGQHAAHPELDATPSAEPTPRAKAEAFFAGFAGDDDAGVLAWSEPSAEPTPRDMRVAEAVVMEAAFLVRHPSGPEGEDGYSLDDIAQRIETLDLAAVVAKAVKP